jgi:hypothetical protein
MAGTGRKGRAAAYFRSKNRGKLLYNALCTGTGKGAARSYISSTKSIRASLQRGGVSGYSGAPKYILAKAHAIYKQYNAARASTYLKSIKRKYFSAAGRARTYAKRNAFIAANKQFY